MIRKTWDEFRDSKLLWWINRSLHLFGWAIYVEIDDATGKVVDCYPARISQRGFDQDYEAEAFPILTQHLNDIMPELLDDVKIEED